VKDNGCGMTKDLIDKIMKCEPIESQSGFGLKAVVMRIALFFEIKEISDIIMIDSKEGKYTMISLYMPKGNYTMIT
jgi:sensor histidine kinase YesM